MRQAATAFLAVFVGMHLCAGAPLPKDDPVRRNPNISRAQKLLGGWTPVVPLEKGIAATIEYFRGVVEG